jgi:2-oxoglutarate ferredoxin oxidoreductase subunit beta
MSATTLPVLKPADFASDQEIRWCPGCGDYSILAQTRRALSTVPFPKEKMVFVSGIGCSSRFPYYMNTYGFHTIHGRAPTIATGLKLAQPDLMVWLVTGDGDGLSIGGNHLIHTLRRNIDIKILLFNNEIYGLTKGQYSPTSRMGTKTKTSPTGSIESPIRPVSLALAAEATFIARTMDMDPIHITTILQKTAAHKGAAFVEILQNCKIFNDGVFDNVADKSLRADNALYLEHGKPLVFGKDRNKGIRLNGLEPEVVTIGKDCALDDIIVHDEFAKNPTMAYLLSRFSNPDFPEVFGVIRNVTEPTYEELMENQLAAALAKKGKGDLQKLFRNDDLWTVE